MTADSDQLYVYGIVAEDTSLPAELTGISNAAVETLDHGSLAAVVTRLSPDHQIGTPQNLLAHSKVLDTLAEHTTVLPMAFGTIVPSDEELRDSVLELNEDEYTETLEQLQHTVQYTVRARYIRDAILADLIEDDPEVAQLREAIAGTTEDETREERIQLGELVVSAFDHIRPQHAEAIIEAVKPAIEDFQEHEGGQVEDVLELAVLVDRDHVADFEDALEQAARQLHTRINFQLLGPQAPYDFVGQ